MGDIAKQRIQREFREVIKSEEVAKSGVQLALVADDLTELTGTIAGPPDTPYEGGTYKLEIKIPDTYPFNPPKVRDVHRRQQVESPPLAEPVLLPPGPLRDQDLAPEHLVGDGRHLPGHPQGETVRSLCKCFNKLSSSPLKDQWAAAMTLRTVLLSLQALLAAPEPDDPQDAVVARQYSDNQAMFKRTAQHWASVYAGAKHQQPELDSMLRKLKDMGVDENKARVALSSCSWDIARATEQLFN
jgi:ubiquitin-conjugating enzyme (huntingtin interacting protein 2)